MVTYAQDYPVDGVEDTTVNLDPPKTKEKKEPKPKEKDNKEKDSHVDESDDLFDDLDADVSDDSSDDNDDTPVIEKVAREQGWVPQDEWEGDPALWRSAEVFVERGQYFDTMQKQNKYIKKLEKEQKEAARLTKMLVEKTRKDTIRELEAKRSEAIEDGDYKSASSYEDEIKSVEEEAEQETTRQKELTEREKNELLTKFVEDNPWYQENKEMKKYADMLAAGYTQVNGGDVDPEELLDYLTTEVKSRFPEEFDNSDDGEDYDDEDDDDENDRPRKKKRGKKFVSKVGSSTRSNTSQRSSRKSKKVATARELNSEQRRIGQRWVDAGAIESLDAYAQSLKEMGVIE